jgi:hypothetical protein
MFDDVVSLGDRLAGLVQVLDPDRVSGPHARRLWEALDRVEKLAAAGKTLLARRLADTHRPDQEGVRSAAEALARRSGTTVGAARDAVDTSTRLPGLPRLEAAMRRGDLSQAQAALVGAAAAADPSAERHLVELAARASLPELREECARVRAAADPDPQPANQRLHRARRLRRFTDPDGAWTLIAKGTPQAGAAFNAALDPIIEQVFHAARRARRQEPEQAYAFDALMEMAHRADTATAGLRATAAGRCHPHPCIRLRRRRRRRRRQRRGASQRRGGQRRRGRPGDNRAHRRRAHRRRAHTLRPRARRSSHRRQCGRGGLGTSRPRLEGRLALAAVAGQQLIQPRLGDAVGRGDLTDRSVLDHHSGDQQTGKRHGRRLKASGTSVRDLRRHQSGVS